MTKPYAALKSQGIPHEIELTTAFVKSLMKISETKPFLDEFLTTPIEVMLLRQAKIRAITYSNQIEGNLLDERAVTALIGDKHREPTDDSEREILNYKDALAYTEKLAKESHFPSIQDFCDIQKLVTQDLIDKRQAGRLRSIAVSIVNADTGKVIDKCPDPILLTELMQELWTWLKETDGHNPYARAFAFHFIAVSIHPFADGNGRSVRLFQHLLLLRQGETIARYVPSETVVMRNRDNYYSSIRQCKKLQSVNPMLEFLADCFATAAQEVISDGKKLLEASKKLSPAIRHQNILKFAKSKSPFQIADLAKKFPDLPRRTLERDLQELVGKKSLRSTGEKRGRKYSI